jgi:predicted alpha/beta superfamily hydrolase
MWFARQVVCITVSLVDLFAAGACFAESTAGPHVQILAPMTIPGLDRQRTLRIYVPASYQTSQRRYPVLYMHDGQNLFDAATSYAGEWGVDESLDALARTHGLEVIVVGIDHGQDKRIGELSPWAHPKYGPAEGPQYMDFVVQTVKPWVDEHYRTLSDRRNTAVMGSSLGSLLSHYAVHQYPHIFGMAGLFSPSYWFSEEVYRMTRELPVPLDTRMYFLVGGKEGAGTVANVHRMAALESSGGHPTANLRTVVSPLGEHNEAFWRAGFSDAVLWLFADPPSTSPSPKLRPVSGKTPLQ